MPNTRTLKISFTFLPQPDGHILASTPSSADVGTAAGHFPFRADLMPDLTFSFHPQHPLRISSLTSCQFYVSYLPARPTSISLPWPIGSVMEFQTMQMVYDVAFP